MDMKDLSFQFLFFNTNFVENKMSYIIKDLSIWIINNM